MIIINIDEYRPIQLTEMKSPKNRPKMFLKHVGYMKKSLSVTLQDTVAGYTPGYRQLTKKEGIIEAVSAVEEIEEWNRNEIVG